MKKRNGLLGGAIAAVLLSGGVLAACTAVVVEERPPPPRPDRPQFCTMEYDPVCAVRGGSRQTFGNACEADRAGYRIVHPGECRRGGRAGPGPGRPDRPQFCSREYAPVCAVRGGNRQTFGNSCEAEAAGYRIIRDGRC
jgi:hypothetical protein